MASFHYGTGDSADEKSEEDEGGAKIPHRISTNATSAASFSSTIASHAPTGPSPFVASSGTLTVAGGATPSGGGGLWSQRCVEQAVGILTASPRSSKESGTVRSLSLSQGYGATQNDPNPQQESQQRATETDGEIQESPCTESVPDSRLSTKRCRGASESATESAQDEMHRMSMSLSPVVMRGVQKRRVVSDCSDLHSFEQPASGSRKDSLHNPSWGLNGVHIGASQASMATSSQGNPDPVPIRLIAGGEAPECEASGDGRHISTSSRVEEPGASVDFVKAESQILVVSSQACADAGAIRDISRGEPPPTAENHERRENLRAIDAVELDCTASQHSDASTQSCLDQECVQEDHIKGAGAKQPRSTGDQIIDTKAPTPNQQPIDDDRDRVSPESCAAASVDMEATQLQTDSEDGDEAEGGATQLQSQTQETQRNPASLALSLPVVSTSTGQATRLPIPSPPPRDLENASRIIPDANIAVRATDSTGATGQEIAGGMDTDELREPHDTPPVQAGHDIECETGPTQPDSLLRDDYVCERPPVGADLSPELSPRPESFEKEDKRSDPPQVPSERDPASSKAKKGGVLMRSLSEDSRNVAESESFSQTMSGDGGARGTATNTTSAINTSPLSASRRTCSLTLIRPPSSDESEKERNALFTETRRAHEKELEFMAEMAKVDMASAVAVLRAAQLSIDDLKCGAEECYREMTTYEQVCSRWLRYRKELNVEWMKLLDLGWRALPALPTEKAFTWFYYSDAYAERTFSTEQLLLDFVKKGNTEIGAGGNSDEMTEPQCLFD